MKLYRYEDAVYSTVSIDVAGGEHYGTTPVKLECHEFDVISETKCGYWIDYAFSKKWVSRKSKKRFAYPSKQAAIESLIIRKKVQFRILSHRVSRAQDALYLAEIERTKCLPNPSPCAAWITTPTTYTL